MAVSNIRIDAVALADVAAPVCNTWPRKNSSGNHALAGMSVVEARSF